MNLERLTSIRPFLLGCAVLGFLAVNGPFLYFTLTDPGALREALGNGFALTFMGEAFFLLIVLAVAIAALGWKRPGWFFFVSMSILGSLAFSIPLQLYLMTRSAGHRPPDTQPGERRRS